MHCKKMVVLATQLMLPDKLRRQFILVAEANCINDLSPNHTLQLTTLKPHSVVKTTIYFCSGSLQENKCVYIKLVHVRPFNCHIIQ